ncbi:hypothetical protein Y032_0056g2649 [Ancylostoma ceylanicum]|uniref:Uncharacterized protein n=1 Tax=Ancylostoma ceylanicum TaxID=53326 RepID=A0A016U533_9BILA|nr:hypothetical protein Y032_0056g2649 [Ancylostoma ceylanicum]
MRIFFLLLFILQYVKHSLASEQEGAHTFLTQDDFQRATDEDEVFLTEDDFRNAELLTSSPTGSSRLLSRQSFLHGDIRGKAAWKLVTFVFSE